ncbi:hypothetical protein EHI8A_137880 [Entamoeba histolytica HM-1:IMSS-B]|uniref:Transmembrane protein 208 n=6 Tax=Entamoeba histolytica TaxID=5759 RepID=C4LU48_ENTH1|nr:hypothetical protein EHI_068570 [Entamoeba histolytica HM-1:IMSS]EMD44871.1 Hypothetical protein EHI5A_108220 [Entamoeba histolytica KU27]EMH76079.1 hypothetical protein EHI8A_137880 [Entamoeba histolytica HM-1:IMSS-B]EMS15528.1 hypothetical protein KM1_133980 [Entamoeba histolytica HM-3:IMSS]ENY65913.1 hypothetical protein EHI7A_126560 [Entamoeba histolytica HM-1:IMSS-A]GAT92118.1 hypothetical protein CL6EHI_068570 [Entamoeba histolytica]|eukprot:XP_654173.1 hypothetical protein EHI_068570 [Entamoeba histolytica HM-1:IMSS]
MANQSQKKTVVRNKQKLLISFAFVFLSIFFFVFYRFLKGTLTGTAYFVFIINALFQCIPLIYTFSISRPLYENGELIDCGSDLSAEGLMDYIHDILYFSSIIQFLSSFSFFAMYLYILVIGYTIYLVVQMSNAMPNLNAAQGNSQEKGKKQKMKFKTRY